MDDLPRDVFLFIHDPAKEPRSVIGLGADMHKLLVEDPDALPALAVDMIVATINKLAVDEDHTIALQEQVTKAMILRLQSCSDRTERLLVTGDPSSAYSVGAAATLSAQIMRVERRGDELRFWSFDSNWLGRQVSGNGFSTALLPIGDPRGSCHCAPRYVQSSPGGERECSTALQPRVRPR
jgi:hypothetical protein